MNVLTKIRLINELNDKELRLGVVNTKSTWHNQYKDSAWIYVGNLPFDLSEGDVVCVCSQYGEIVNINMIRDKKTGKSKGFAFVCYEDQRSTVLAVDNLNGSKIKSRQLRVDHVLAYKVPKENEDLDELTLKMHEKGVGPEVMEEYEKPSKSDSPDKVLISDDSDQKNVKKKKKKEKKKEKKKSSFLKKKSSKKPKTVKDYQSDSDSSKEKKRQKRNVDKEQNYADGDFESSGRKKERRKEDFERKKDKERTREEDFERRNDWEKTRERDFERTNNKEKKHGDFERKTDKKIRHEGDFEKADDKEKRLDRVDKEHSRYERTSKHKRDSYKSYRNRSRTPDRHSHAKHRRRDYSP